ncbi:MAG: GNAT family N-acetyltransferase [Actinobacteria bacterium]|nr:GNAT family N-acetyltransferase [Actinomycetota bacterium]
MRRQLTAVDDDRHVALIAEVSNSDEVTAVGVARLIAVGDDTAEVTFAIVDAWHGRGIGRRLLTALRYRAIDLGYRMVTAHVMAENRAAAGLRFCGVPGCGDAPRRDGVPGRRRAARAGGCGVGGAGRLTRRTGSARPPSRARADRRRGG